MSTVHHVLVVGAGCAGTAAAILLAEAGMSVDLIDTKPDVGALGSGITLQGNALRVLRQLGVWDQVRAAGAAFDDLGLRAPDADATLIAELTEVRTGGADLPATLGIYRPELAKILVERAEQAGARIRFATSYVDLEGDADGVDVTFTDGTSGRYDLVIAADGLRSLTRRHLDIDLETRATGMGIWRVFASRPASVTRTDLIYGGRCYIAGYCPTGPDSLYAYLVEDAADHSALTPDQKLAHMLDLAESYHGPWDDIRARITDASRVSYTWFETHLLTGPWNRGRVVLIGDAVHACPPTLAQGAAMALEDAAVLTELITSADSFDDSVLRSFSERRMPRVRAVVEASVQLVDWQLAGERGDVPGLMARTAAMLTQPA